MITQLQERTAQSVVDLITDNMAGNETILDGVEKLALEKYGIIVEFTFMEQPVAVKVIVESDKYIVTNYEIMGGELDIFHPLVMFSGSKEEFFTWINKKWMT